MSKRKRTDRPVQLKTMVPASVKKDVDILLLDPVTGKVEYGAMSALITRLLRGWVKEHIQERKENARDGTGEPLD